MSYDRTDDRCEAEERWKAIARQFVHTARKQWLWEGYITYFVEALMRERGYTLRELQDGTKVWRSS